MKHILWLLLLISMNLCYSQNHYLIPSVSLSFDDATGGMASKKIGVLNIYQNPSVVIRSKLSKHIFLDYGLGFRNYGYRYRYPFLIEGEMSKNVILGFSTSSIAVPLSVNYKPFEKHQWFICGLISLQKALNYEERTMVNPLKNNNYVVVKSQSFLFEKRFISPIIGVGSEYNFKSCIGNIGVGMNYEIAIPKGYNQIVALSLKYLIPIQKQNK